MGDTPVAPPGDTGKILPTTPVEGANKVLPGTPGKSSMAPSCVVIPDTSVFDASWFDPSPPGKPLYLRDVLDKHNAWLPKIEAIRTAIIAQAESEVGQPPLQGPALTGVLDAIRQLYTDAMRGVGRSVDSDALFPDEVLIDILRARDGHAAVFDPWDGWWAGQFDSLGTLYQKLHVWDPTVEVQTPGAVQHVQGVTQVDAFGQWFGSAARLSAQPDAARGKGEGGTGSGAQPMDFAINVWSPVDGITGFVRKGIFGSPESLPHAGFLLDDNTLLWAALVEPDGGAADGKGMSLMLFVEPGFARKDASGVYSIRGARGIAKWSSGTLVITQLFDEVGRHKGDYRAVVRVSDERSLQCAIDTKALGGMSKSVAEDVLQRVRGAR